MDYAGSTGYGREYRNALRGSWGVADVDDCVAAARFLADRGDVDGERMAIEGGSAGGYTTLAALAFRDVFAAGISEFGVGDLEALARDTHKFESRYLDRLVGPYPAAAATLPRAVAGPLPRRDRVPGPRPAGPRRPRRPADPGRGRSSRPSPPTASRTPTSRSRARATGSVAPPPSAGRSKPQIGFLGAVFGFTPADGTEPLELPGLDAWRARRRTATADRPA